MFCIPTAAVSVSPVRWNDTSEEQMISTAMTVLARESDDDEDDGGGGGGGGGFRAMAERVLSIVGK